MSRSQRLLDLLQLLRRHRRPVQGAVLAERLGISARTLYRDIATLQAQGAGIEGAPGVGYVLREGFMLPPLMFSSDELEAITLGIRWVRERGDGELAAAAADALARIGAVLPEALRFELDSHALMIGPSADAVLGNDVGPLLRRSIRAEVKVAIDYRDGDGRTSRRTVWPFALGYFDQTRILVAWCELRAAIRHFRCDRIVDAHAQPMRYPRRRQALLAQWKKEQGVANDAT